jgi:uncharacterized protein (DUF58 family)
MSERSTFYQKIKLLRLTSKKLVEGLFPGMYRSAFRGPGLEFHEVREYTLGDDSRFIDWNVTSRLSNAYTKVYREEREMNLTLVADLSQSMAHGLGTLTKREIMSILFAHLVYAANHNGDRVGAIFFSKELHKALKPRKGNAHAAKLLQYCLGSHPRGAGTNLTETLLSAHQFIKRRGIFFIMSDFRVGNFWSAASRLASKHEVIMCRIYDPLDLEFPNVGFLEVMDSENAQIIPTWGANPSFRKEHRDFNALQRLIWLRECKKRGIRTLEISTTDDPGLKLIQFFESRGQR